MIGRIISHYRVLKELSHGGMGTVFLAEDISLSRKVALKFPRGKFQEDPVVRKRFLQEAHSAAAIDHPFICKIYEIGEFEEKIFIAMEYLEGQTLHRRLEHGAIPLKEALRIGIETAEALEEIHQKGIMHRDLKPANIMLVGHDHVKVMDFGLARPFLTNKRLDPDAPTPTPQHEIVGTLAYIAPEQFYGDALDKRSDIYSFGTVLYEMIAGVHPFRQEDDGKTLTRILNANPPPLARYTAEIPELLEHTLRKMLAKELNKRYQSIHEIWTNLVQLRENMDRSISTILKQPTIAVLPFIDMSSGKDQAYLCEGLAEELINALAKLENLRVAARTSAFRFKNTELDIRDVGRQLNVQTILEGSVRKSGDNLRIGVELINVEDGFELWSQQFDRRLDDLFAIQDEISRAVLEKLKVSLFPVSPASGRAYALYLQGRFYWNKRTEQGFLKSIECFDQAVHEDEEYALAYAGLAASHVTLSIYGVRAPSEAMPDAKSAAEKALANNSRLALAHAALGCVRAMYEWNWAEAENDFKNALEIEPRNENVHQWYATHYLIPLGRFDEAFSEMETAKQIDPLNLVINASLGMLYYFERRYDRAIEEHLKTLEMDQNLGLTHLFLGQTYAQKGMFTEAISELQKALLLNGGSPETKAALGYTYAKAGEEFEATALHDELKSLSLKRYVSPVLLAQISIGLDHKDEAFEYLEKAYQSRSTDLIWLKTRPVYDSIRSDPRFDKLCIRIGFP